MVAFGRIFASAAAAAAVALSALPASSEEVTLSAVNFVPNTQAFGVPLVEFAEKVNKEGKGLLQISIKPAGTMSPFTMGNAIKTGVVDFANLPATFYQNLLPVGEALKLATKLPDEMRTNGLTEFLDKLHQEKVNAKYLLTWGWGVPFHAYLRDKKIDKPDLTGLKMRTTPVYRAFFRALGADLIQTPPQEVYTALERGTIDGYGWPIWDIKTVGWDKVTKYRVDPGFYQVTSAFIMNLDKWKSLSKEQQDFLLKAVNEYDKEFHSKVAEKNAHYIKEQADAGVQVIEFTGAAAEKYLNTAYEAGWEEHMKLDPENAKKLRALISK
ncbi:MAG TPA: TRAP transporter substrate-binding protein DctP [Alphaproteobacteria bacterium]